MMKLVQSECCSFLMKRRRMLQFSNEAIDFPLCTEELSSFYLKLKARKESEQSLLPEMSPWDDLSSEFVSRIRSVLRIIKQNINLLCVVLTDKAQPLAVKEVVRASSEAFLMVLLAGGSTRVFLRKDHQLSDTFWS